jgi:hypothetical protein
MCLFWVVVPSVNFGADGSSIQYALLGEAFTKGNLYLPIEPSRQLLELSDPYNPELNLQFRYHDLSLFNAKYYLYFGPAPALIYFAPLQLIGILPDVKVYFIIISLFQVLIMYKIVNESKIIRNSLERIFLISFLFSGSLLPILLRRPAMYEMAIITGSTFVLLMYYYLKQKQSVKNYTFYLFQIAAIMAILSRPNLFPIIISLYISYIFYERRKLTIKYTNIIKKLYPTLFGIILVLSYNYLRFGDILEFGRKYQLSGVKANGDLSLQWIANSMYAAFLQPPTFINQFPFVTLNDKILISGLLEYPYIEKSIGLFIILPSLLLISKKLVIKDYNYITIFGSLLIIATQIVTINSYTFRYLGDVSAILTTIVASYYYNNRNNFSNSNRKVWNISIVLTIILVNLLGLTGYFDPLGVLK